ncbi:hypothetical protein KIK84_03130 [Curvibacter sp. CHRR-16]|uniref:hypothetical protein n=1 Tax=Curvibacter sp. CHRR-16 TaxID=2835872 RepID=UPI001BD95EB3|nr:hypothetical protein [Curvibacter sp. CHRR-16]MBT0569305.1 hypothetical protein [Curvibacter sp. CHRR-16]
MKATTLTHSLRQALLLGAMTTALVSTSWASSTASSAISQSWDSFLSSTNSVSDSITSSSTTGKQVATARADYAVVEVVAVAGKPDWVQVHLQATTEEQKHLNFALLLPKKALPSQGIKQGDVIHAEPYDYGVEFSTAADQKAFYLAVFDDKMDSLISVPVTL